MSDVNLQFVREFFELNLFHTLPFWQHAPLRSYQGEHSMLLFVENTRPAPPIERDFVLYPVELPSIERAMVDIRAWHADRFYPSVIESNHTLTSFTGEEGRGLARDIFGTDDFVTILVVSALPRRPEQRSRSCALLKERGVDHVLEFPAILQDLLDKVSENTNYATSQTLQVLRLLKRYRFIRYHQMEFDFPAPAVYPPPLVETTEEPLDYEQDDSDF